MLKNSLIHPAFDPSSTRANLVWAMLLQVVEKASGYVVLAILTRSIPAEQLGLMFFAATISEICAVLLSFGTDNHLMRVVAAEPGQALGSLGRVLSIKVVNALLIFAGLNLLVGWRDPQLGPVLLIVSAYDFLEEIFFCFSAFLIARKQLMLRLLISGSYELLGLGAVAAVALLTRSLFPVLWTYLLLDAALLIVAYFLVRKYFGALPLAWRWRDSWQVLRASAPFFLLNFLALASIRSNMIVLGALVDFKQVADYGLGLTLVEVTRFIVRPVNTVFFPVFTEYVARDEWPRLGARFWQLMGFALLAGSALLAGMLLFGPTLMVWLFSSTYLQSVAVTQVLFISVPLIYLNYVAAVGANAVQLERPSVAALAVSVGLNLGLNIAWIPQSGIFGAAWATIASQAFLLLVMLPMIGWRLHQRPHLVVPGTASPDLPS